MERDVTPLWVLPLVRELVNH